MRYRITVYYTYMCESLSVDAGLFDSMKDVNIYLSKVYKSSKGFKSAYGISRIEYLDYINSLDDSIFNTYMKEYDTNYLINEYVSERFGISKELAKEMFDFCIFGDATINDIEITKELQS